MTEPDMIINYKRYNQDGPCAKCGCIGASSMFYKKNTLCTFDISHLPPEWIERICQRCGYQWTELPLDAIN